MHTISFFIVNGNNVLLLILGYKSLDLIVIIIAPTIATSKILETNINNIL